MKRILILILILTVVIMFPESLWKKAHQGGLISVRKASNVGDIVRVMVYELPIASLKTNSGNPISAFIDFLSGIIGSFTGLSPKKYISTDNINSQISRKNEASAKIVLQIASVVVGKDEYGNLIISGHKKIKVGSEMKEITIKGKVRPEDISADNTVDSRSMAEAEIWIGDQVVFKKNPDAPDSWIAYFASMIAGIFM